MYVIVGLGQQGRAICRYLLNHTQEQVHTVDIRPPTYTFDHGQERWFHYTMNFVNAYCLSVEMQTLVNAGKNQKVVLINCLPTEYNHNVLAICIMNKWNYIDLGGSTGDTIKCDNVLKLDGLCAVPDCGVAPGLVSSLIGTLTNTPVGSGTDIRVYCGGLPLVPKEPSRYAITFSPQGVIKEYRGAVEIIDNRQLKHVPALSGYEEIFIPGLGYLEAAYTSGSLSTTPEKFERRLQNLSYKTLRYPGHWKWVKDNILNQADPVGVLSKCVETSEKDLLIIHVVQEGPGCHNVKTFRWDYDDVNKISAMSQSTGYTVGAMAKMIHEKNYTGLLEMHDVRFWDLKELIQLEPNQLKEVKF